MAALKTVQPKLGETSLALLGSTEPLPVPTVLTPLINELSETTEDIALVLDDYHFVQSPLIHEGITFLLEHRPSCLHLVVATRADPPVPLALFRGKGTILELRADDLRFSLDEACDLQNVLEAPALSGDDVQALNAKAEGWAVGLKMALLSLKREANVSEFIASFTGTQRYIMDYLIEEVLQRQAPEVRDFLLRTSVLDRLSGPLCDAVTGRSDGQEILMVLEKANLFIMSLDETRQWYRYEHLFDELLRHHLKTELGRAASCEAHRRASDWYAANGFPVEAINHALEAQEWETALALLLADNPVVVYGGPATCHWLRQIPEEVVWAHPAAFVYYAWAIGVSGQFKAGGDLLDACETSTEHDDATALLIARARLSFASYQGDPMIAEYARQVLSLLPPDDEEVRILTGFHLGVYYAWTARRYNEAEPLMQDAYAFFQRKGQTLMESITLMWLAYIALFRGKLHRTERLLREALGMTGWNPNTASQHMLLSVVYHYWNDRERELAEWEKMNSSYPIPSFIE